jgi:hypothetical protein
MVEDPEQHTLDDYRDADEWEGGAWIGAGAQTAVVFVGTKGGGDYWWYGYSSPKGDGAACPFLDDPEGMLCFNADGSACSLEAWAPCQGYLEESRGWWSSRFDAQLIFYNPADFAAVVSGAMAPHDPQPYGVLDIDEHLFLPETAETSNFGIGDQRRYRVGEMAYDRERGLLYVFEHFADGAKPVIHVWGIRR